MEVICLWLAEILSGREETRNHILSSNLPLLFWGIYNPVITIEPRHWEQNRWVGCPYNPPVPYVSCHGWRRGQMIYTSDWDLMAWQNRGKQGQGDSRELTCTWGFAHTLRARGQAWGWRFQAQWCSSLEVGLIFSPIRSQLKNCTDDHDLWSFDTSWATRMLGSFRHSDHPCSNSGSHHLFLDYHNHLLTIFPVSALPTSNLFHTLQTNLPTTILLKSITHSISYTIALSINFSVIMETLCISAVECGSHRPREPIEHWNTVSRIEYYTAVKRMKSFNLR